MAEAIFIDCIKELDMMNNWEADSAALRNYHIGKSPNPRTEVTLRLNGIINYSHKARIVSLLKLIVIINKNYSLDIKNEFLNRYEMRILINLIGYLEWMSLI